LANFLIGNRLHVKLRIFILETCEQNLRVKVENWSKNRECNQTRKTKRQISEHKLQNWKIRVSQKNDFTRTSKL